MKRLLALGVAGFLLAGVATAVELVLPARVAACSCVVTGPEQIGTFADEPGIVVFTGTVTSVGQGSDEMGHTAGTMTIHEVFKGDLPSTVRVIGGGGGDCTISIQVGQRMITAASFDRGAITPGLCMPYGDPVTPEGQRLVLEATRAYGPGRAPPGEPPSSDPPAAPGVDADLALPIALGAVLAGVVVLFGAITVLARRREAPP